MNYLYAVCPYDVYLVTCGLVWHLRHWILYKA